MKFSLRAALAGLWALMLALCVALAFLMYSAFERGAGAQLRQAQERLEQAAGDAARRYERYRQTFEGRPLPLEAPQTRSDLEAMLTVAFSSYPGVEGGFWHGPAESIAYAFPTHDGPRQKTDLPLAELEQIRQVVHQSLAGHSAADLRYNGETASILLHAQPLADPPPDLAVWAMTRAPLSVGQSFGRLTIGLGTLLLLAIGSGLWLLYSLRRWTNRVGVLEESIASTPLEELPPLASTGERELDRIVTAFNHLNARLKTAREERARLGRDLARADRLAALGRMAAGLVHEIGNPLAAMRLRSENALAADPERAQAALHFILPQIGRLEEILGALRLLTKTAEIHNQSVALVPFLLGCLEEVSPSAGQLGIDLRLDPSPPNDACWHFDEKSLSRAVSNLLLNALQHAPRGGSVAIGAEINPESLRILVADDGPGVVASDRERIFEPFVTGRTDGIGLGLSIVREIAEGHGGIARCLSRPDGTSGAVFVIEIPNHGQNIDRR